MALLNTVKKLLMVGPIEAGRKGQEREQWNDGTRLLPLAYVARGMNKMIHSKH
jgi:hypothetical protein